MRKALTAPQLLLRTARGDPILSRPVQILTIYFVHDMTTRKVLVGVKRVVDYAVRVRVKPDGTGVDTSSVKMSMNPFCEIAVEEALRIRDAKKASEVIAISVGNKKAADTLRVALAMGVDKAIHVTVPENHQELQPLAIASVLKHFVLNHEPDMVILGKQSIDGDNNQTGQMLAGMLGWPQVCFPHYLTLFVALMPDDTHSTTVL